MKNNSPIPGTQLPNNTQIERRVITVGDNHEGLLLQFFKTFIVYNIMKTNKVIEIKMEKI